MKDIAPIFDGKTCRLEYFVHLPQSTDYSSVVSVSTLDSASLDELKPRVLLDEEDAARQSYTSMFSTTPSTPAHENIEPTANLSQDINESGLITPKKKKKRKQNSDKNQSFTKAKKSNNHTIFDNTDDNDNGDAEEEALDPNESIDSVDLAAIVVATPKLAAMLSTGRSQSKKGSIPT